MAEADQPGAASWPITGASFILVYASPPNPAETAEALKFFDWAYKNGSKMAAELQQRWDDLNRDYEMRKVHALTSQEEQRSHLQAIKDFSKVVLCVPHP